MTDQGVVPSGLGAVNSPKEGLPAPGCRYRERLILGFGLFAIFFVFYMGTAIINTPTFKDLAAIPVMSMPLGMFLSLAVFPVSWVLIVIYFVRWR